MIKNTIYLIILLIAFISCSKETEAPTPVAEGETQVTIALQIPEMSTRDGITNDKEILSLSLLVFGQNSETGLYELFYKATATAGEEGNYTVTLRATDDPARLFLIANTTGFSAAQVGDSPEEAAEKLITPFTENGFSVLPMSTIIDLDNLPSGEAIEIEEVELVRSVAGIQVYLDETNPSLLNDFTLKSIQVYRANSYIQIVPNQLNGNTVSAASVPVASTRTVTSERIEVPDEEEGITTRLDGLYISESNPVATQDVQSTATCLILGGYYQGSPTESYYRIDFGEAAKNNIGQLLRNHRYTIKIKDVTGPGTTFPEEADDKSIVATIPDWEESEHPIEL
ncbi:MAG: FimB/Mfa2 family fimbrial subunit [Tannerellaceae bacterium]|nr:FimB/Mfa2 family fimbrial subunit [Tannerellaceae bacterium]